MSEKRSLFERMMGSRNIFESEAAFKTAFLRYLKYVMAPSIILVAVFWTIGYAAERMDPRYEANAALKRKATAQAKQLCGAHSFRATHNQIPGQRIRIDCINDDHVVIREGSIPMTVPTPP